MKKILLFACLSFAHIFLFAQTYTPTAANLKARKWFEDARFGMFIHWGVFSIPGDGEWVMTNKNITVKNYTRLENFFNPIDFDAAKWIGEAKAAGMKYITLITRHHDGFSLWDTKFSDFNITHTPYKKDIVKMMAEECRRQGIKLFLYYSLLDWRRDDYAYWTGRTGQGTGRTTRGKWEDYIQFMKNQLTELLTNYGEIGGIWFDGYWDQMPEESATRKDTDVKQDWHIREIYDLIHKLQPQCLIGNNHHMTPIAGEDFQMFEQDVPGENSGGLSFQKTSALPLETCATINGVWGFSLTDTSYKSNQELIQLLVKSVGANANLLLNFGPMPNGAIQPEFTDRLSWMGTWLKKYGESIYNTTGGYLPKQDWGVLTQTSNKIYIHILYKTGKPIELKSFPFQKISRIYKLSTKSNVDYQLKDKTLILTNVGEPSATDPDQVIVIEK